MQPLNKTTEEQTIKTACLLCPWGCGMNLHVSEGRIVKAEGNPAHPLNKGRLCPKAAAVSDYVYSPDRLRYPLKKENGEWKRISWDEALDTVAEKLMQIKQTDGARAFAVIQGMAFLMHGFATTELLRRFTDAYGTPNVLSVDSICYRCRVIGYMATLGRWVFPDAENARCIVLWAHNPDASCAPHAWRINKAMENGAKLVTIDPRRTPMAKKAHIHAQPRPGSDSALALGILNTIIKERLYDEEFVRQWTVGFDRLADHVEQYTPEQVEKVTWVPSQTIKEIARLYAATKPACIIQGTNALDQKSEGVQNARSIAILQAITGNYDVPGGFVAPPFLPRNPLRLPDMMEGLPLGSDEFPLFYQIFGRLFGEGQAMVLPEAILKKKPYPVKAVFVTGSNPVLTWPNSSKVREALEKVEFLVVMDLFMTETAKLAHLVLPAASFLETTDLVEVYAEFCLPYTGLRQKVMQVDECWSDAEFWLRLARRMGYEKYFPWADPESVLDYTLVPSGLTVRDIRENHPGGLAYGSMKYQSYINKGFRTPSGKVELYSETLKGLGYDPLPVHREPPESPLSNPELAREYPLILTTGARIREYLHSQYRNIDRLRRSSPEPVVEIHPTTAGEYGIGQGETVVVETKRGQIEVKAQVTEDIVPGVLNIAHGWSQANVNLLTDETPADSIAGNPPLKALLCRVKRK